MARIRIRSLLRRKRRRARMGAGGLRWLPSLPRALASLMRSRVLRIEVPEVFF